MPVIVRPFHLETDAARLIAIYNQWAPEPLTVQHLIEGEEHQPEGFLRERAVAEDDQGGIVGYLDAWHGPWEPEGGFEIEVVVDRAWRRQGIWQILYAALESALRGRDAARLTARVRDNEPEARRFAEQRGFVVSRHLFESTLDLATFDESGFTAAIERQAAAGVRFVTLADLGDTEAARRKLFALNIAYERDIPGHGDSPPRSFDEWQASICQASWYDPAGQIVALAPGAPEPLAAEWVGLTALGFFPETNSMYQMTTGVDRAWRGRGLALALKLLAIHYARTRGVAYIRTNNDSENAPILAVNRKLGFQPRPGIFTLRRAIDAGG